MTKRIFSLLALALLFAACSNIDDTVLDTPTIPTVEGKQNIVEESEFSSYIDWQTYAGDDFYRYATGAWQDRTTLVGDEESKGIMQEQRALADAYLKKVYKEGTMPQLSRIFQAYRSDDKAKVIRLIQDKLDNIDREVNTKEDAWKKMAALMKDGYYVPMDFTVWPLYRKVYAALLGNRSFGNIGTRDLEVFIKDEAEKLAMIKISNEYGRIAARDDLPKWGRENCTSDDDDIVLMGDEDDRGLTRSENFPETTPLGQICKELDITEGKSTGIPTITAAMKANGSPVVKYEFDDSYSWFMATVPVHPVFLNDAVNETENETENETILLSQLSKRQQIILRAIAENDKITERQMMQKFSVSRATITRATTALKKMGIIIRIGSDRNGSWMIVKKVIGL